MSSHHEADILYRALFGHAAPAIIVQRFGPLSAQLEAGSSAADLAAYQRVLTSGADLEALEFAARLTSRLPLLTRKLAALVALAETLPENQSVYLNTRSSWPRGVAATVWAVLRSAALGLYGLALLRRGRYA
ncbi:MAG: hypothetical protein ABTQ73_00775 [Caldilineales bacterium]